MKMTDLLHTVSESWMSKFPEGKVLILQEYFPSSDRSVSMMIMEESTVGSLLLNRTRLDHRPNAARDRPKEG